MSHDEAIQAAQDHLHLVGTEFKLPNGETESIKAVVAWKEAENDWQPHVCFYNWAEEENPEGGDGQISHMNLEEFIRTYLSMDA